MKSKIVLLATEGLTTTIVYNSLKLTRADLTVIIEQHKPKSQVIKFRIKKLGLLRTINQLFFIALIPRLLKSISKSRMDEIFENKEYLKLI